MSVVIAPPLLRRNGVLLQLVLQQALGDVQQLGGLHLHEIGLDQRPADDRRLDLLQRFGEVELGGQQVHGALELRLLVLDLRRQIVGVDGVR